MNRVFLVGRLTRDPEIRYTQSGTAVATFTLAVERRFVRKDANNPNQQTADFIPIVAWRKLAEVIGNNLTKGKRIGVEGSLHMRTYDDKNGNKRYVYEVVIDELEFLDKKEDSTGRGTPAELPEEDIPF